MKFATLETRRELKPKRVSQCLAIVSGIFTGDVSVSYWPVFPLSLVTVQKSLKKLTKSVFLLVSKVANYYALK